MNKRHGALLGLAGCLILIVGAGCGSTPSAGLATSEPTAPVAETPIAATEETGKEPAAEDGSGTFYLIPEETEARFVIDEILAGELTSVVGATNAVEGSFVPDFDTPSNTTVDLVRVDMSQLLTDNGFRNNAIHSAILQTGNDAFRYAEFETTALTGLPEKVEIGQPFDFQITGNLGIHGVTKEVTFDATATAVSETRLEGIASMKTLYSDFGVSILRMPPQVASVADEVILEIEFAAAPR